MCGARQLSLTALLTLFLAVLGGCDRFPRDPGKTLETIQHRGTLRVGVLYNSPWATGKAPGDVRGLEGRLIAEFATELGVAPEWYWGGEEDLFEGLIHGDFDVVIGGFTQDNPWAERVGFTNPYYINHAVVGVPPSQPMIDDLSGVTVAARPRSRLAEPLGRRGAIVVERDDLVASTEDPIAADAWEIEGAGFRNTGIELRKRKHVIAVPPGENALILRLERFLGRQENGARMAGILWETANQ